VRERLQPLRQEGRKASSLRLKNLKKLMQPLQDQEQKIQVGGGQPLELSALGTAAAWMG
jgi:hypothetical protein